MPQYQAVSNRVSNTTVMETPPSSGVISWLNSLQRRMRGWNRCFHPNEAKRAVWNLGGPEVPMDSTRSGLSAKWHHDQWPWRCNGSPQKSKRTTHHHSRYNNPNQNQIHPILQKAITYSNCGPQNYCTDPYSVSAGSCLLASLEDKTKGKASRWPGHSFQGTYQKKWQHRVYPGPPWKRCGCQLTL